MTYDLHGGWEWKTGHHTAMKPSVAWDSLSVPNAVDYWMTNFGKEMVGNMGLLLFIHISLTCNIDIVQRIILKSVIYRG